MTSSQTENAQRPPLWELGLRYLGVGSNASSVPVPAPGSGVPLSNASSSASLFDNDASSSAEASRQRRPKYLPAVLSTLILIPIGAVLSVVALPLLSIVAVSAYAVALLVYFIYSDETSPLALFLQPLRVLRINRVAFSYVSDFALGPLPAACSWMLRTLSQQPSRLRLKVARDIPYSSHFALDVYPCGPNFPLPSERTAFPKHHLGRSISRTGSDGSIGSNISDTSDTDLSPVLVIIYGGMWRSGDKGIYGPAARWWRERGFVVVVGNYGVYPRSRLSQQLHSLRSLLLHVHDRIRAYGGDPSRINVLAHDSGAHLLLLSLLIDAENTVSAPASPGRDSGNESAGSSTTTSTSNNLSSRRRSSLLPRSGPRLPPIEGVIVVGGVYDVVEQDRWERSRGWEHVSALNRVMGPSLIQASPLHKLQSLIHSNPPPWFPRNWWLVHGTRDTLVPVAPAREFAATLQKYLDKMPERSIEEEEEDEEDGSSSQRSGNSSGKPRVRTWFPAGARHFDLVAGTVFDTSPYAGDFEEGVESVVSGRVPAGAGGVDD